MPTIASCTVVGHLYEPPKPIGSGDRQGASFRFYTSDRVKGPDGEYAKEFTSHSAAVWGKEAEWLIRDGVKGSLVAVTGSFRVRKWEKDGKHGAGTDIQAQSARILDRKEEGEEAHAAPPAPRRPAPSAPAGGGGYGTDSEPPFMRDDLLGM